ncbi:MAG: hypothetical protein GX230_04075 [Lentisphaerae bacterium]|nr:hypothetical protein [Lentisphaerota bacterium]
MNSEITLKRIHHALQGFTGHLFFIVSFIVSFIDCISLQRHYTMLRCGGFGETRPTATHSH